MTDKKVIDFKKGKKRIEEKKRAEKQNSCSQCQDCSGHNDPDINNKWRNEISAYIRIIAMIKDIKLGSDGAICVAKFLVKNFKIPEIATEPDRILKNATTFPKPYGSICAPEVIEEIREGIKRGVIGPAEACNLLRILRAVHKIPYPK